MSSRCLTRFYFCRNMVERLPNYSIGGIYHCFFLLIFYFFSNYSRIVLLLIPKTCLKNTLSLLFLVCLLLRCSALCYVLESMVEISSDLCKVLELIIRQSLPTIICFFVLLCAFQNIYLKCTVKNVKLWYCLDYIRLQLHFFGIFETLFWMLYFYFLSRYQQPDKFW